MPNEQQALATDNEMNVAEPVLVTKEQAEEQLLSRPIARLVEQKEQGVVNPIVLAEAIGVRPQMIYQYIRNGRIAGVRDNNTQKITIAWSEAVAFAQRYLDRRARQALKTAQELEGK